LIFTEAYLIVVRSTLLIVVKVALVVVSAFYISYFSTLPISISP